MLQNLTTNSYFVANCELISIVSCFQAFLQNGTNHRMEMTIYKQELEVNQAREKFRIVKAPQITEKEAKKLKQEILQQEVLIQGYQVHFNLAASKFLNLKFYQLWGTYIYLFLKANTIYKWQLLYLGWSIAQENPKIYYLEKIYH